MKIFKGKMEMFPFEIVQHISMHWYSTDVRTEDNYRGINVITKHTRWSSEFDDWENPIYLERKDADTFIEQWTKYIENNN